VSDEEYAHQALSALERIDIESQDKPVRECYDDAMAAVDELAAMLAAAKDDTVEEQHAVDAPEEWADDEDEWDEKIDDAYDEAEIPRSKGTLTVKTIDDREYYYLQWREGEKVKSQYVAPVSPA